jgi:hypothetical protein
MAIDMASVYAERFRQNPNALRAAVMGQSPDPKLDSYTALNALRLIKEADMMAMSAQAQQPTSSPSILAETLAPPAPPQGLAGMPMGAPAGQMPQGQAPQPMPQAPVMQASGGLAGLPTPDENYAAGGIVAFNGDDNEQLVRDAYQRDALGTDLEPGWGGGEEADGGGGGGAGLQALAFKNYQSSRKAIEDLDDGSTTAEEDRAARRDYLKFLTDNAGPDIYKSAIDKLTEREGARGKNTSQGQGLALLAAAGAILEGNTLARGAAKAFPVFAKEMAEVQRADIAEQRSIEQMRFALDDAKRKERMGDVRGAQAAAETARKLKSDATKFQLNKANALATLDAKALQATRTNAKGAGSGPKLNELAFQANVDNLKETTKPKPGESPTAFDARIRAIAADLTTKQTKTSFSTSEIAPTKASTALAPVQANIDTRVAEALNKFKQLNGPYRKAVRTKDEAEAKRLLDAEEAAQRKIFERSESNTGSPRSGNPNVIKLD